MVNLVKSFVGLGILAAPSGFQMTGFVPASCLILINAALSMITISFQTRTREFFFGQKCRVKTYSDLGEACYGTWGRTAVSVTIALNQVMCCIGYVMFFMEQLKQVLTPSIAVNNNLIIDDSGEQQDS